MGTGGTRNCLCLRGTWEPPKPRYREETKPVRRVAWDHLLREQVEALSRLRSARVARLATVRPDGRPHVVPIVFAIVDHGERLAVYWAVDRAEALDRAPTTRNISVNPHVELVADGYDENWERLWWVRAAQHEPDGGGCERVGACARRPHDRTRSTSGRRRPPTVAIDVAEITGWQAAPDATG